jgi:NADH:ubiquinone oxidoreductase subunit C
MIKNKIITENFKNISKICPIKKIQCYNTEITIIIQTKDILKILLFFKNHFLSQFKILTCVSGVDYPKSHYRFSIVYDLLSIRYNSRLRIKIFTYELGSVLSSTSIFAAAGWFESEIWDMYGSAPLRLLFRYELFSQVHLNTFSFSQEPSQGSSRSRLWKSIE